MGRVVVDLFGHHRTNNGDVIDHLCRMGEKIAHHLTAMPVLAELGLMTENSQGLALQLGNGLPLGKGLRHGLAVHLVEFGLVVEGFEMGRTTRHAQEDHAFGLGQHGRRTLWNRGRGQVPRKKGMEGGHSQAKTGLVQEGSSL